MAKSMRSSVWSGLTAAALVLAAGGCVRSTYQGISLLPGAAPAEIQSLAQRARYGDKHAQLELGRRFELGQDVPPDPQRAIRFYRLAASATGGTLWVYSPPVGQSAGRVIPINMGPRVSGLPEAAANLRRLQRSIQPSVK